ncbi:MAG: CehA/McbA family metallohydrolase [Sedimentisphaerales bacterium]|nr:CehA/McbA family metallohydrolase [Sedimentisphaerales bacterium]
MMKSAFSIMSLLLLIAFFSLPARADTITVTGEVVDADTGAALACRIYIRGEDGRWHFARSAALAGSAVAYQKQNWNNKESVEMHTTLSAHGFAVDLPPGEYDMTVERGKEYFPATNTVTVGTEPMTLRFKLKRWVDMAELGWYSGDTHVHRSLAELPNVQLAEDLNVSFPLLYWVTHAFKPPSTGDKSTGGPVVPRLIHIDKTHVIYPMNTEYELFSVGGKRHTLGAFFILNHKSVFTRGVPPVTPIAEVARREGALLELDKHNWPWSMMLVPVMDIDLFELANNHMWRTQFAFTKFGEAPADYMDVDTDEKGFTERGWIGYGFQNYYALLSCGFRLRPTAGTASGVHPVPLGHGRVYVKLEGGFDYDAWMEGLDKGRSFVTTGPMLFAQVNGFLPGHAFQQSGERVTAYSITGSVRSAHPLESIEIVVNADVSRTVRPQNKRMESGAFLNEIDEDVPVTASSWLAVRCFEQAPENRVRFAHTGPFHIEADGKPLCPRKEEIEFLMQRVQEQIERNKDVLPPDAIQEYRSALDAYREIAASSR